MSSSLIGLREVSSVVEALMSSVVEALNFASVADGFLGASVVVFRMFVLLCVRGLSIQKDFVGHLFWVRCVHLYFVVIRLTW